MLDFIRGFLFIFYAWLKIYQLVHGVIIMLNSLNIFCINVSNWKCSDTVMSPLAADSA